MSEKKEVEFVDGLIVKAPHDKTPDFVKCGISIKRENLINWLQSKQGDWINLQVKVGKSGKWYAEVDNWKPENKGETRSASSPDDFVDSDLPF